MAIPKDLFDMYSKMAGTSNKPDPLQQMTAQMSSRYAFELQAVKDEYMRQMYRQMQVPNWLFDKRKPPDPNRKPPKSDIKLPEGILPGDGKAVGYIYGYRAWKLDLKTARLRSDNFDHQWEPKVPQQAIDKGGEIGKGAGIYAAKEIGPIEHDYEKLKHVDSIVALLGYQESPLYVIGKVALWGAIKEHKKGYRAEYAYPSSFLKVTNVAKELEVTLLRAIAEIYLPR
jgi:hypothetical protein